MVGEAGSPSERSHSPVEHLDNVVVGIGPARDYRKAKHFLQSLSDCPFLCIVLEDGRVKLYEKGMPVEDLEDLLTALERTIPEHADDEVGT